MRRGEEEKRRRGEEEKRRRGEEGSQPFLLLGFSFHLGVGSGEAGNGDVAGGLETGGEDCD